MPKRKASSVPLMGSKAGYEKPLTAARKEEIGQLVKQFTALIEQKYPGMDFSMVCGPHTVVSGCTTALVLQIINLISILTERIDDSEEGIKLANLSSQLLIRLMPMESAQKICRYYDGEDVPRPHKIQGPEANA